MAKFSARRLYSKIFNMKPCFVCGTKTSNVFHRRFYICSKECFKKWLSEQILMPSESQLRRFNKKSKQYGYGEVYIEEFDGRESLKVR